MIGRVQNRMCHKTFAKLAKEADAIREYGKIKLVNVDKVDEYNELVCRSQ